MLHKSFVAYSTFTQDHQTIQLLGQSLRTARLSPDLAGEQDVHAFALLVRCSHGQVKRND